MNNNILLKGSNAVFEPHILNDKELPFIFHYDDISDRDFSNFHENLELLYFTSGTGYVICDSQSYPVKKGEAVIINSYVTHQIITDSRVERFCLIIDNNFCKYNNIDISRLKFTPFIHDKLLNSYFEEVIHECYGHEKFENLGIKCAVLNLLLFLCRNYSTVVEQQVINNSTHEYIRLAIEYIKSNLGKKLTADAVAASSGLSKYHFLREFKKSTGYTLVNYINIIRCEYAKELLTSGKYNVKETALLCGFENFAYFSNVFKKYTGALPSDFLKVSK